MLYFATGPAKSCRRSVERDQHVAVFGSPAVMSRREATVRAKLAVLVR